MRVIIFSRFFPKYHPKAGERTLFVAKIIENLLMLGTYEAGDDHLALCDMDGQYTRFDVGTIGKSHTIRAGNRWKVGDVFSPRIWSGLPYRSKQIEFAPPIEVKKVWDVVIRIDKINGPDGHTFTQLLVCHASTYPDWSSNLMPEEVAQNDGLDIFDFQHWFEVHPKRNSHEFKGQIICWNDSIEYCHDK